METPPADEPAATSVTSVTSVTGVTSVSSSVAGVTQPPAPALWHPWAYAAGFHPGSWIGSVHQAQHQLLAAAAAAASAASASARSDVRQRKWLPILRRWNATFWRRRRWWRSFFRLVRHQRRRRRRNCSSSSSSGAVPGRGAGSKNLILIRSTPSKCLFKKKCWKIKRINQFIFLEVTIKVEIVFNVFFYGIMYRYANRQCLFNSFRTDAFNLHQSFNYWLIQFNWFWSLKSNRFEFKWFSHTDSDRMNSTIQ